MSNAARQLSAFLFLAACLLPVQISCTGAPEVAEQPAEEETFPAQRLQSAMGGVWELESRTLADGKVLKPPDASGLILANETHSVALVPLLEKPSVNLIFAARNEFSDSAERSTLLYLTCSANAERPTTMNQGFEPEEAAFSSKLNASEADIVRSIAGEDSLRLFESRDVLVQRLPETPVHAYAGDRLTVIDKRFVDSYVRKSEDQNLTRFQKGMMGSWELQSRTTADGKVLRPPQLTGFILATANHAVALIPLAEHPESNLIFAVRSRFSDASQTSRLFYLTCSANNPEAQRVMRDFPEEKVAFDDKLSQEEWRSLKTAAESAPQAASLRSLAEASRLPEGAFVQRVPESPVHVYAGDDLFVLGKGFTDVYRRTGR